MLLREITEAMPEEQRARYRVVRLDSGNTVPGLILSANANTGECTMKVTVGDNFEKVAHMLGANGLAILGPGR